MRLYFLLMCHCDMDNLDECIWFSGWSNNSYCWHTRRGHAELQ